MNHRRTHSGRLTRRRLIGGMLGAVAGTSVSVAWPARYQGRLYPGVAVLGLNLGGLTHAEAAEQLQTRLAPFAGNPVTFRYETRRWAAHADELGIYVDVEATIERACQVGRDEGVVRRYARLIAGNDRRAWVPVLVKVESSVLAAYLDGLARDVERDPRDAELVIDGLHVSVEPERPGARLDIDATRAEVLDRVEHLAPAEIALPVVDIPAAITAADLDAAYAAAATALSNPVTVILGDRAWTIMPEDLAKALVVPANPSTVLPRLDHATLVELVTPVAAEVNHPPRNATVAWDGGLYALSESYSGAEVDVERLAVSVAAAAFEPTDEERVVELPLNYTPAAVDANNLEALAITTHLARGSSSFGGSSAARATNVAVATQYVTQTLIPPGEVFSFNRALGPITPDQGYVEGMIIAGDWFASDLGGGVCQVSTTVFRAALLAGLSFVEWHPHSFRLGFYELDGWPPGMDAAIYVPNTPEDWEMDLRFANPTDGWMLLQLAIEGNTLIADLYGTPTGYEVELSEPILSPPTWPTSPVERPTPDLPSGVREQVQVAQPGMVVTVTRRVTHNGHVIAENSFVSDYRPQADVFLVGTGET